MAIKCSMCGKIFVSKVMSCAVVGREPVLKFSQLLNRGLGRHISQSYFFFFLLNSILQFPRWTTLTHSFTIFLFILQPLSFSIFVFEPRLFQAIKQLKTEEHRLCPHVFLSVHLLFFRLGVSQAFLYLDWLCHIQPSPLLSSPPVGLSGRKVFQLTQCFRNVNTHKLILSHGCLLSPPVCHVASGDQESVLSFKQNILILLVCTAHIEGLRRDTQEPGLWEERTTKILSLMLL